MVPWTRRLQRSVGAALETETPVKPKLIEAKPIKANALDEEKV
jgi:hypothetical protein